MLLRSPTLASVTTLCLMIFTWFCLIQPVVALQVPESGPPSMPSHNDTGNHLLCTPFGACEPCPPDAMNQPFCQPFGNRRLMHCLNTTSTTPPPSTPHPPPNDGPPQHPPTVPHPKGETLAWESCGRIPARERADFYEFVACNVAFALIALGILLLRSRRMQLMQARQLAARIGLIRGDGGGGRGTRP
ncbi:hypothetical protein B0H34DRAFT_783203 [Crassisporium funariophilum]|nr:hypothetical protein B0H34DRAFT_783203 [Crassisporium funariophilum]